MDVTTNMPRRPRVEKEGFHHIVNSGVARGNIFVDNEDYMGGVRYQIQSILSKIMLNSKINTRREEICMQTIQFKVDNC